MLWFGAPHLCHHPAKYDGNKYCGSGDTFLQFITWSKGLVTLWVRSAQDKSQSYKVWCPEEVM